MGVGTDAQAGSAFWVSNAEDAGGGGEAGVCHHVHGEAMTNDRGQEGGWGDLSGPWACAEESTLETDW